MQIDYFFSPLSDWSYFGGERLELVARRNGAAINYKPINLGNVYKRTGGILLKDRSKQRQEYRVIELERWRDITGIPITLFPKHYPTDDELSCCSIIAAQKADRDSTGLFANAILRAIWVQDRDISSEQTLRAIANGIGFDGDRILAIAKEPSTKQEWEKNTDEAVERGVFGAPFYFFEGHCFWGQDRLPHLEDAITAAKLDARCPRH